MQKAIQYKVVETWGRGPAEIERDLNEASDNDWIVRATAGTTVILERIAKKESAE
jgi:hypothetical protein